MSTAPGSAQHTDAGEAMRAANAFDLRRIIGGLFLVYGVILVIRGLLDGPEQLARAAGTAVNLWTGIGLVVVSLIFLVWARTRPLGIEVEEAE